MMARSFIRHYLCIDGIDLGANLGRDPVSRGQPRAFDEYRHCVPSRIRADIRRDALICFRTRRYGVLGIYDV